MFYACHSFNDLPPELATLVVTKSIDSNHFSNKSSQPIDQSQQICWSYLMIN